MAQKVTVQLVDDLDGTASDDISTVAFGLDGVTYEIDLTEANAATLRSTLDNFVSGARRTGGRVKRGLATAGTGTATTSREQSQAVRDWARRNGFDVSARGRISATIMEAFEAAQVEGAKGRKRKTRATAG